MAIYRLLKPIKKADHIVPNGMSTPFRENFWKGFNGEDLYKQKTTSIVNSMKSLLQVDMGPIDKLYMNVKLDEASTSKTQRPSQIWTNTNLDIVEYKDEKNFVVSGTREDFVALGSIAEKATFSKAKEGSNISKRDKDMYRELYAISSLMNRNTDIQSRISNALKDLIIQTPDEIDVVIEIYSDINRDQYNTIFVKLNEVFAGKITRRDERFFISNMIYNAKLKADEIYTLLGNIDFNFVSKIRLAPNFILQRYIPTDVMEDIKIGTPETEEKFILIDSGTDHPLITPLRDLSFNFVPSHRTIDNEHGTFVASRILFGEGIFKQIHGPSKTLIPVGKFIDVQILCKDSRHPDKIKIEDVDKLKDAIDIVARRYYNNVFLINFSIANEQGIQDDVVEDLTVFIDTLSRELDILIICAVGNHDLFPMNNKYNETFADMTLNTRIASPSDAFNSLSVGATSFQVDTETFCIKQNYPSIFSRIGNIRKGSQKFGIKKPEVVINGGNIKFDAAGGYNDAFMIASSNKYGVEGIGVKGLAKYIGTSQSAPLITRQCLQLSDYLRKSSFREYINKPGNRSNLIKTLIIHSTSKTSQLSIREKNVKYAYGFGIPDYTNAIEDDDNQGTIIYGDTIDMANKKHILSFELPQTFLNKDLEFIFTLVYNPPVNPLVAHQYNMAFLKPSLGLITGMKVNNKGKLVPIKTYITNSLGSWNKYRQNNFNVVHFKKTTSIISSKLEVTLKMEFQENYTALDDFTQNYILALTIKDPSSNGTLRNELLKTNQFEVLVENQISVTV